MTLNPKQTTDTDRIEFASAGAVSRRVLERRALERRAMERLIDIEVIEAMGSDYQ